MAHIFVFIMPFLVTSICGAQSFQPVTVPMGLAEKIIVRGYKGKIQITEVDDNEIRVEGRKVGGGRFDQWKFQVRKKQNNMEVVVKGPSESEDWEKVRSEKNLPSFELKISAPKRAMEVFWAEGSVLVKKWTSPLKIQMTEGDISVEKSEGSLMAQLIKGRLKVADHLGNVGLQTFNGQVFVERLKGALSINNHSASYQISELEGPSDFRNHSGTVSYKTIKGQVRLKNVSGVVSLNELDGSFEGDLKKGAINVVATRLQSFVANSDSSPVTLKVNKKSGARVKLRSEKGRLIAPIHLRKVKKGRWSERIGRLKGEEQGQIKIISKYGDIVLK